MMAELKVILLEGIYIIAGLVAFVAAIYALKDKKHPHRIATALFWGIFGIIFIIGKYIPANIIGVMILVMGVISAMKKVVAGSLENDKESLREEREKLLGNKIFIPALAIGITAFAVAQAIPKLGGLVGLGAGAILATLLCMGITKAKPQQFGYDGSRMLMQVGAASILPQLLTALGALFNEAGVGEVIAKGIGGAIPDGNILFGVIAYCVGMAIFTIIMGNAFAAFAVITAGIGMPFVYAHGGNPAIIGILALTAGYCGTLMTPMAANFNIVPAAILEMKDKNKVMITQVPVAASLLVVHIILMYTLGF